LSNGNIQIVQNSLESYTVSDSLIKSHPKDIILEATERSIFYPDRAAHHAVLIIEGTTQSDAHAYGRDHIPTIVRVVGVL
jgi:hypothetical protein